MQRRTLCQHALLATATAALGALAAPAAWAQAYPAKPITVIVPFAVGGGSDNVARLITTRITERTGKTFVIDNRGGAGTNIGHEAAARASADGYTVLLGQFTLPVNAHLYPKLRYAPEKDFVPVVHIATAPTVLVVPAGSVLKDVAGLRAAAKAKPGKLNFGSGGAGTSVHLAGELFQQQTQTDLTHVPYKGSGPAMVDLIGGQIDMIFDTATSALSHLKVGKIRALGVTGSQRLKDLPQVPTFAEQGMADFDVPAWYGVVAPAGTPAAAVQWLNAEVNAVLKEPAIVARLDALGAVPVGGTPAALGDFMKSQSTRWGQVIRKAGITLE
ncbi:Bug family tripartite tricarboxylate transporter substrate binding protein [Ideonella livida]|uniref:Tripartite tricarboxylate transporter substrate binding protein n=1 Tax=Ideonella livida TaxID=2707176 RepID=A0A7C9PJG4_9BURK|nr:tripartite tricarboxylate transporter substrate binding protein [Ideonella livida]NDY93209.1 tripartite tricarboxylate transporter substrate binding protein [Ideonella livida]